MMLVRQLTPDDMMEVSQWFVKRKWPLPPNEGILPNTGYVAQRDDGKLLSVAWLYLTNSKLALIEWTATNPDEPVAGIKSLSNVVDYIKHITKDNVTCLMQLIPNKKLSRHYQKKMGFKKSEEADIVIWRRD